MPVMTKTPPTTVRIPESIKAAAAEWCEQNGVTLSQTMLIALCHHIGRPELIDAVRSQGRPVEEVPAKPTKKAPRKRK